MNRRLFLTSGISMMALSGMAKGLEDSPFFKGTIADGPFLPYWESLKAYRCSELKWKRGAQGLEIQVPGTPPCKYAFSFRIAAG